MGHAEEKDEQAEAPSINIKLNDPVRDPRASTTNEDIARADGEGMAPRAPLPTLPDVPAKIAAKPARKAPRKARR